MKLRHFLHLRWQHGFQSVTDLWSTHAEGLTVNGGRCMSELAQQGRAIGVVLGDVPDLGPIGTLVTEVDLIDQGRRALFQHSVVVEGGAGAEAAQQLLRRLFRVVYGPERAEPRRALIVALYNALARVPYEDGVVLVQPMLLTMDRVENTERERQPVAWELLSTLLAERPEIGEGVDLPPRPSAPTAPHVAPQQDSVQGAEIQARPRPEPPGPSEETLDSQPPPEAPSADLVLPYTAVEGPADPPVVAEVQAPRPPPAPADPPLVLPYEPLPAAAPAPTPAPATAAEPEPRSASWWPLALVLLGILVLGVVGLVWLRSRGGVEVSAGPAPAPPAPVQASEPAPTAQTTPEPPTAAPEPPAPSSTPSVAVGPAQATPEPPAKHRSAEPTQITAAADYGRAPRTILVSGTVQPPEGCLNVLVLSADMGAEGQPVAVDRSTGAFSCEIRSLGSTCFKDDAPVVSAKNDSEKHAAEIKCCSSRSPRSCRSLDPPMSFSVDYARLNIGGP